MPPSLICSPSKEAPHVERALKAVIQPLFLGGCDPALAVQHAREIDLDRPDRVNWMSLRAATLVNAGASLGRPGCNR